MNDLVYHSAEALSLVDNYQLLWLSFCNTFTECSALLSTTTVTIAFEDGMRRLRLAHRFLTDCLKELQTESFRMQEGCRVEQLASSEFAGLHTAAANNDDPVREDRQPKKLVPYKVVDLVRAKVAGIEENIELATELLHSLKHTTSAADWTRFALLLNRGSQKI